MNAFSRQSGMGFLAVLVLAWLGPAPVRADVAFRTVRLRTAGRIDRRVLCDADGDGRVDVVLFHNRTLLLFLQGADRTFRRWPHQVFRIARSAVLCEIVRLLAAGGTALVWAAEDGLYCHPFREGKFERKVIPLVRAPTALGHPGPDELLYRSFLFDVDGDGHIDAVLPREKSYTLYRQDEKGRFTAAANFPTSPAVSVRVPRPGVLGELSLTARFPLPLKGDFDGDGRPDFLVRHESYLLAFLQRKGGTFATHPLVLPTSFPEEKAKKTGRFSFKMKAPVLVEDLNGDGVVDVVKPQPMLGRTLVFLRRGRDRELRDPHLVVKSDGWPLGVMAPDLNGDGLPDLVIGHVNRIGVLGAVKIFLSGRVTLHSASVSYTHLRAHET